jgi:hypothetical protein
MPLIEAALAFAITMLALSLVCSSFVEIIHRVFSMREDGLKHMLGQMFDQVLAKYIVPELKTVARQKTPGIADALMDEQVEQMLASERESFVERMKANRAPMGVKPKATPADPAAKIVKNKKRAFGLWSGRDLTSMTPAHFMERLGSIDIGETIERANAAANAAGAAAADAKDAVLKDVAQKFEAFGKEAGEYFAGRARLLSVLVAIGVAFAAHVDAIDLFKTYLRDPNARAKVIEQSQALTAQYKSAQEAADAIKRLVPDTNAAPADQKAQLEKFQKDLSEAIAGANTTVTQYAGLGVPLGWSEERIAAAHIGHLVWRCRGTPPGGTAPAWIAKCKQGDWFVWFEDPTVLAVWLYLFLGGLLIGLGSPFWYDVVTGLTNIRSGGRGQTAATAPPPAAVVAAPEAGKAQPVTPVGAFHVSHAARTET